MKLKELKIGISPCPNDTFAFCHLIAQKADLPFKLNFIIEDVESLNKKMLAGEVDVSKVSFHALGYAVDRYMLLRAGSALGWGCGPLLLSSEQMTKSELADATIAIPGEYTTAALLLKLFQPKAKNFIPIHFSKIPEAIQQKRVDAGVIIHESRFTYKAFNLTCLKDLGAWWEKQTGMPIPLGGIAAKRAIPQSFLFELNRKIRQSIEKAWERPEATIPFMKLYAAEMSYEVMLKHVNLYVNTFTAEIGKEGEKAISCLFKKGFESGIFNKIDNPTDSIVMEQEQGEKGPKA